MTIIPQYEPARLWPPQGEGVEEGVHAGLAADEAHRGGVVAAQLGGNSNKNSIAKFVA